MHSQIQFHTLVLICAVGISVLGAASTWARQQQIKKEGEADRVSLADLPQTVRAVVEKLIADGKIEKIEKENEEGKVVYDVEVKVKGKAMEFGIDAAGKIVSSEEEIEYSALPAAVRAAVEAYFGTVAGLKASKEIE